MSSKIYFPVWLFVAWSFGTTASLLSEENLPKTQPNESVSSSYLYSPGSSSDRLQFSARISQYQKLISGKNYQLSTIIRIPSINGGERVDREISEKSQQI